MNKPIEIPTFRLDHEFARAMAGFYVSCPPEKRAAPRLLKFNRALAKELQLDAAALESQAAEFFSGNLLPSGAVPLAQAYAGHQFGNFVPQLGDGRAHLLGEIVDRHGVRRDVQLKGSGCTPFSREGDGRAAVGPMLREYLMGEAMHALGIPTTRALAVVASGEEVARITLQPGAVLARVAQSHIRIGTFEYFAARNDITRIKQLADYAMRRHYPDLASGAYLELLKRVIARQADLVARWMGVGFIHGVMNTDNMAISGETLDYGPCAFLEHYAPEAVFSSIDHHGRYAFGNQPAIAQWNLARFAETLLPLLDADQEQALAQAREAVAAFAGHYDAAWLAILRRKLGFNTHEAGDAALGRDFLQAMQEGEADYTLAFRALAKAAESGDDALRRSFISNTGKLDAWLPQWRERLRREQRTERDIAAALRRANPQVIPRNHLVEEALEAASTDGDLGPFDALLAVLADPFAERAAADAYTKPAPPGYTQRYRTFCGT